MADEEGILALIYAGAASGSCASTSRGFLCYCDLHGTHGNADTKEEAEYVAAAHANYFQQLDPNDEPCDLYVEQAGPALD